MKHQTYWSFIKYTSLLQVIIKVNHSKLLSKFNEKICVYYELCVLYKVKQ